MQTRDRDARSRGARTWIACGLVAGALAFGAGSPSAADFGAERVFSGLTEPTLVTAPAGDPRLFIVERAGRIRIADGESILATPFLDIHTRVSTSGERGLFGLAFAPDFASSGLFYVYYTDTPLGRSVISRFRLLAGETDRADASSEEQILVIDQPYENHNGGTIAFSPIDGMLYFSPGDGGSGNDPGNVAQDPRSLLGKMLRIDVSGGVGTTYTIPASNPFAGALDPGNAIRDEIWAFGLRNPFRFGFDRTNGELWIGDVGQNAREEVDREAAGAGGKNYGWDVMEGTQCNATDPAPAPPCNDASLTLPVHEYDHGAGCAITGGTVYRGSVASLQGRYVFGDFCSARIWALDPATNAVGEITADLAPAGSSIDQIVAFGEDGDGEVYVVDLGGEVFRIRERCTDPLDLDCDGVSNALDPCTTPSTIDPPAKPPGQQPRSAMLSFAKLDTPAGDDRTVIKGQFNPASFSGIDPSLNGVHLQVEDELGTLIDVDVPGGLAGSSPCHARDGWKVTTAGVRRSWRYTNASGALATAGCAAGSAGGVSSIAITDATAAPTDAFVFTATLAKPVLPRVPAHPVTHLIFRLALAQRTDPGLGLVSPAAIAGQCAEAEFEGSPVPSLPVPKSAGGPVPYCKRSPATGTLKTITCKGP